MSALRVGGVVLDRGEALAHARRYLTDGVGWAYPSYDAYERQRAGGPLSDADLLAPVLLNVSRLRIKTYETLQAKRDELDEFLACIPLDLELASANPDDLAILGDMFAVLDGPGVWGARGTVLAKILHRKRPGFVPLYDEQVRRTYQEGTDPAVPRQQGRTWREFIVLFAAAVQADLRREAEFWAEITALAVDPPITPLRALDIVAWWAGHPNRTGVATA